MRVAGKAGKAGQGRQAAGPQKANPALKSLSRPLTDTPTSPTQHSSRLVIQLRMNEVSAVSVGAGKPAKSPPLVLYSRFLARATKNIKSLQTTAATTNHNPSHEPRMNKTITIKIQADTVWGWLSV